MIENFLKKYNISAARLSQLSGYSETVISRWKSSKRNLPGRTVDYLCALALLYDVYGDWDKVAAMIDQKKQSL